MKNQKEKIKIIEKFIVSNDLGLFLQSVVFSPEDNKFIIKMKADENGAEMQISGAEQIPNRLSRRERNFTKKYEIIAIDEDNREYIEQTIRRNGAELGNSGFLNTNWVQILDSANPGENREYFVKPNNVRYLEKEEVYIIRNPPKLDTEGEDSGGRSPQLRPSKLISQYDFVIDRDRFEKSELVPESGREFGTKQEETSIRDQTAGEGSPGTPVDPNDKSKQQSGGMQQDSQDGKLRIKNYIAPNPRDEIIKKYIAISYVQPLMGSTDNLSNVYSGKDGRSRRVNDNNNVNPGHGVGQESRPKNTGSFLKNIEISGIDEEEYWRRKNKGQELRDQEFSIPNSERTRVLNRGERKADVDGTQKEEQMSQETRPFQGQLSSPVSSNRSMYHRACKSRADLKPKIDQGFYAPKKQLSRPLSYVHPEHQRSKLGGLTDDRRRSPKSTRTVAKKGKNRGRRTMLSDIPDQDLRDEADYKKRTKKINSNTSPLPIRPSKKDAKSKSKSKGKVKVKVKGKGKNKGKIKPTLEDGAKKYTLRMPTTTTSKNKNMKFGKSNSPSRSRSKPRKGTNRAHAHRFKQNFVDKNAEFYVKSKARLENRGLSPQSFWNLEKGPFMGTLLGKKKKTNKDLQRSPPKSEKAKTVRLGETSPVRSKKTKNPKSEIHCDQRDYYTPRYYHQDLSQTSKPNRNNVHQVGAILPGQMPPSQRYNLR